MSDNMHEKELPVKERIQNLSSLPSLAVVKYHLVRAFNNERVSVEDISDLLRHDPAMTSKVMAIANSAFFGCSGRIGSIDQAVMLLGFDLVRSIAFASTMFSVFASQYGHLKMIWAHSYIVGSMAGRLCRRSSCSDEGACFVSGLIHDIGRLVILRIAADRDVEMEMYGLAGRKGDDLLKAEIAMVGCNHCDASKWFLESLCLPADIIRPIETHHAPETVNGRDTVFSPLYVAEGLASLICPEIDSDGEWTEDHARLFHEMGMSETDLDEIRADAEKDRASAAEFIDL